MLRPRPHGSLRRFFCIIWITLLWGASVAAQGSSSEAERAAATAEEEAIAAESAPEPTREEDLPPQLRAPSLEGLQMPGGSEAAPAAEEDFEEEFDESAFEDEDQMARDDAELLSKSEPPASDPTLASWTNPRPVFSLNGYFRLRGEYIDNFSLRRIPLDRLNEDPFARWIPIDNAPTSGGNGVLPQGGCKGEPSSPASQDQRCDGSATLRSVSYTHLTLPTMQ